MRTLFAVDVGRSNTERALTHSLEEFELSGEERQFVRRLVEGALAHVAEIDEMIHKSATRWSLERMARTDRNILRMAVFELTHEVDVPPSVAVNEAVELAKRYGDADSGKFVNGILGQIIKEITPS